MMRTDAILAVSTLQHGARAHAQNSPTSGCPSWRPSCHVTRTLQAPCPTRPPPPAAAGPAAPPRLLVQLHLLTRTNSLYHLPWPPLNKAGPPPPPTTFHLSWTQRGLLLHHVMLRTHGFWSGMKRLINQITHRRMYVGLLGG